MSYKHVDLVRDYSATSPTDRLILVMLASRINITTGTCHPGINLISKDTGLSPRTITRRLRAIEKNGELSIERQALNVQTRGGIQATNRYRLTIQPPKGDVTVSPPCKSKGMSTRTKGDVTVSSGVMTGSAKGDVTVSPESGMNQESEPVILTEGPIGLTGQILDYEEAEIPEIRDYQDIHTLDPIIAAIAITGGRKKHDWGFWVKTLNNGRKVYGKERAERLFRGCLEELYGEIKQGEWKNPAAGLNKKLAKVFT